MSPLMKINLSLSWFPPDYRREACHNREDILTEVWWFKFESCVVGVYVCVYLCAQKFVCVCVWTSLRSHLSCSASRSPLRSGLGQSS